MVNQLAVFLENKKGSLNGLSKVLADGKIDLLTMTIADTKDFGIVRIITTDNKTAFKLLKEAGFTVSSSDLIGVIIPDVPGSLADILSELTEGNVDIEYLYCYARTKYGKAVILLKVADVDKAMAILKKKGVELADNNLG